MKSSSKYSLKKLSYLISFVNLFMAFARPDINAQSGFSKAIPINANVDIDDIIYHNNSLILRGNISIESLGLWGLLIVGLDTSGILKWQSILFDSLQESHIILNTPDRFLITNDNQIILPVNYYNTGQLAVYYTNLEGNEIMHRFYPYEGEVIFPFDINQVYDDYYLSGVISYQGGDLNIFVLKLKPNGDKAWIKYFGLASQFEISADAYINDNQSLTLYADRFDADFLVNEAEKGWKKPWIFTIDTSGSIIENWIGEENDPRTLGGEFFTRLKNGDYILQSTHYKKVPGPFGEVVKASPTITRLDRSFNMIWKK